MEVTVIIMRDSLTVITCHSCTDINAIGVSNPLYIKLSGNHFIRRDNTASYVLRVYYKEFELNNIQFDKILSPMFLYAKMYLEEKDFSA